MLSINLAYSKFQINPKYSKSQVTKLLQVQNKSKYSKFQVTKLIYSKFKLNYSIPLSLNYAKYKTNLFYI